MKYKYLVSVIFLSAFLGACASGPAKPVDASSRLEAEARATGGGQEGIFGTPAPDSKFSKLKLGLTLKQVVALIGPPTSEWQHPTAKVAKLFYFGPDRWVIKYAYKGEGQLTFSFGGEQFLTWIIVNTAE